MTDRTIENLVCGEAVPADFIRDVGLGKEMPGCPGLTRLDMSYCSACSGPESYTWSQLTLNLTLALVR